jgi:HAD superfamily hydrolase (TIGR01509 family)
MKRESISMNNIKGVFFDLDGVLLDAVDWHYEALNKALELFGLEINRYEHLKTYNGLPTRNKLEILSAEKGLPIELHSFINQLKQKYTLERIYSECKPIFHLEYALSRLKSDGYKVAVCSNSVADTVRVSLEKLDLAKYVDVILSNEDVRKSKPDPEIYLTALDKSGLAPSQVIILEDNEHGIQAALKSGCYLLQVQNPKETTYERIRGKILEVEREES